MNSKLVMRGMIGFYIFLFFLYLFGPLLVMSVTAFNTPNYPTAYPFEGFTLNWFAVTWGRADVWQALTLSVQVAAISSKGGKAAHAMGTAHQFTSDEARAAGKKGGAVLLTGPAGIGKSRLVKEFSFNARLENLPYAEGWNHEFACSPYGPIVAILRESGSLATPHPGEVLRAEMRVGYQMIRERFTTQVTLDPTAPARNLPRLYDRLLLGIGAGLVTLARALDAAGVEGELTYVSTAGGAFLEWLEGKTLPGVAALMR